MLSRRGLYSNLLTSLQASHPLTVDSYYQVSEGRIGFGRPAHGDIGHETSILKFELLIWSECKKRVTLVGMPAPCPCALGSLLVPAAKFRTRAELMGFLEVARMRLESSHGLVRLADLSFEVGLAPQRRHRCFRKVYGATPRQYQERIRLGRAMILLRAGARATEVAAEMEYAELSSFSRAFTREFGSPPSAFRKK